MIDFNFGEIPKASPHLLADVAELLLPFGGYTEVSKSDIENLIDQGPPDSDLLDEDRKTAGLGSSAEKNDKLQGFVDDAFIQLSFRQTAFGPGYPFKFERGVLLRDEVQNSGRDLYFFLLTCSRLRSFPKNKHQVFASMFEKLCREVMKELMPPVATIRVFGANSEDRQNHYGTNYQDALRKLGADLNEYVIEEHIKKESTLNPAWNS